MPKSSGDQTHPCRTPVSVLNQSVISPSTIIAASQFSYTQRISLIYCLIRDPIVRENVPHGRAMNAIESCLKVYKDGKGRQLKLDTFFNQHPKVEDLVCTTTPTPEMPLLLTELFLNTFSHPVKDDMPKYFARNRQEGDPTVIAADRPIPFLKDGTNQTLVPVLWNNLVIPDFQ